MPHVSGLFNLLNDIEVIGKGLSKNNDINNFDQAPSYYINNNKLTITTKAQFQSPGDIWNSIAGMIDIDNWAVYVVMAYAMLFDNQKLGFDGIIDIQTRQKMWDLVLQRKKDNKAEHVIEALKLELPKHNTTPLESDTEDEI